MAQTSLRSKTRPKWVWAIFIFTLLSLGLSSWALFSVYSGSAPVSPKIAADFSSRTILDHAFATAGALLYLSGAVALLMLRKISFFLIAAAFVFSLLLAAFDIWIRDPPQVPEGATAFGMLLGYCIWAAICVYAWKLKTRGLLS
jgi:hypothetical protein